MSEFLDYLTRQGDQFRRARLPSLYSDFTFQRYSNPDGFAANTNAWIEALTKAAWMGLLSSDGVERDVLSLRTGDSLLRSLESKEWGRPLALKTVIDEAVSQRKMIPYEEFVTARKPFQSHTWTTQPLRLFLWGLEQLGLSYRSVGAGQLPTANLVITRNVDEAAGRILNEMGTQSSQTSSVYPISIFRTKAAEILNLPNGVTENDLRLILTYLARDKSRIVYDLEIVKFKAASETTTLSIHDKTIASLRTLIADINTQIEELSKRISAFSDTAQKAINNNSRTFALAALRSKKLTEAILTQRSETLAQLEGVYNEIEQAADQVAVVRAMEASTEVIRNLHAQVGDIDKVEGVIEGLREEMGKVDDIGGAIKVAAEADIAVNENLVDEELKSLERQANAREEGDIYQTQARLANITAVREPKETQQELQSNHQQLSSDGRTPEFNVEEGITS